MLRFIVLVGLIALAYSGPTGPGVIDNRCPRNATPDPPLHLNDPSDCRRFFTCANGLAVPFRCPSGQHWSINDNRCDWPERARCEEGGSCPPGNPDPPVHLPHETDCDRFYQCSWGVPVIRTCPPGQHWSVQHGWCDWPERANCEPGRTTTTGRSTSTRRSTTTRSTTTRRPTTTRSTTVRTTRRSSRENF